MGCKRAGFFGSLRKGVTDSMVNITDTPTPQKEVILSKRTCIYYKHVKQQEDILKDGATTQMLVEVTSYEFG